MAFVETDFATVGWLTKTVNGEDVIYSPVQIDEARFTIRKKLGIFLGSSLPKHDEWMKVDDYNGKEVRLYNVHRSYEYRLV